MRIELKKRDGVSTLFAILSPFVALGLTLVAGVILFLVLGKDPIAALYSFFIEPLTEVWSLHELAVKAAPLILIAVGLSVCFRSNNWNIGAEGQFIIGAMAGSILPVVFHGWQSPLVLPLMMAFAMIGGAAYAAIPAFLKARLNTNEILTSLMLVYVAQLFSRLDGARSLAQIRRDSTFPKRATSMTTRCCRASSRPARPIGASVSR